MYKGTYLDLGSFQDCVRSDDYHYAYKRAMEVANSGNPFLICDFAENVPLADNHNIMQLLEDGIIACNDIYHEYEFAFTMADSGKKCFNLNRFEERIMKSGVAKIMYYCLECLVGCNCDKMEQALIKTKDAKYIELFMNNDEVAHRHDKSWYKNKLNEIKEENKSEGKRYLPKQLTSIANNLDVLTTNENDEELLISSSDANSSDYNPMHINMCAEYTDCNRRRAFELMMNSGNILHIYEYYCSVANDKEKDVIYQYVLKSGYAKIMYYMIAWTDLDVDRCEEMLSEIEKLRNKKYIEKAVEALKNKENIVEPY